MREPEVPTAQGGSTFRLFHVIRDGDD